MYKIVNYVTWNLSKCKNCLHQNWERLMRLFPSIWNKRTKLNSWLILVRENSACQAWSPGTEQAAHLMEGFWEVWNSWGWWTFRSVSKLTSSVEPGCFHRVRPMDWLVLGCFYWSGSVLVYWLIFISKSQHWLVCKSVFTSASCHG